MRLFGYLVAFPEWGFTRGYSSAMAGRRVCQGVACS
jgi:hypothetical protein